MLPTMEEGSDPRDLLPPGVGNRSAISAADPTPRAYPAASPLQAGGVAPRNLVVPSAYEALVLAGPASGRLVRVLRFGAAAPLAGACLPVRRGRPVLGRRAYSSLTGSRLAPETPRSVSNRRTDLLA